MSISRRRLLRQTLGSATLLACGSTAPRFLARAAAAAAESSGGDNVLVVVQLSGGNDGLNTVVPYANEAYGQHRTTLRIAANQVLRLDDQVGLHPRMRAAAELVEQGWLAVVQGVGYPNPNRSHFRSMDIWHSAQPEVETPRDGWLGRALEWNADSTSQSAGDDVAALHLGGETLPLALMARQVATPSLESLAGLRLQTSRGALPLSTLRELATAPRPEASPLLDFVTRSTVSAYVASEHVRSATDSARTSVAWPNHRLAEKLRQIAQLIDSGLKTRIYYVSLDGFDTHANQAAAHGGLLAQWSESVKAFLDDLAARHLHQRVAVLSFSEFGRRVRENASGGTDHGAAGPVFVAGGSVAAGLLGEHPSLDNLDRGDLRHHTDFRQVYATLLDRWLGLSSRAVLGDDFENLPLFA